LTPVAAIKMVRKVFAVHRTGYAADLHEMMAEAGTATLAGFCALVRLESGEQVPE
jgi:hypothetical protein